MNLVWKLLRQHVSIPQLLGFFFANLFGMLIVLLGYQFYRDVVPVFTSNDSFMKADYLIISKKVGAATTISGRSDQFSAADIDDMESQAFVESLGKFTSSNYRVNAEMSVQGTEILNSELFFESVPDKFVDAPLDGWKWHEGDDVVPVILPRTYITMYNFGFAKSRSLPKISDGLAGLIDMQLRIHGNGKDGNFKGKVIGFSNRLNTILVPQSFMDWSNKQYSAEDVEAPTRLIVEVGNPADDQVTQYIDRKGYEVDADKLNAEKTMFFLKMIVSMVLVVGLVISALSFYILMLSIYLLVQKNADKMKNLLLIGYSPSNVALPYQLLTVGLNISVLIIAMVILFFIRGYYMDVILNLFPELDSSSIMPTLLLGLGLFAIVSLINVLAIRKKIMSVW
ncbi:MAG: ABC transporter permease [Prevotella sp.]|jgi:hypothetical protein|nr:ABC transporter permease [Prevotella sp.]